MKCRATLKSSKSGAAGGVKKKYVFYDIMTFLEDTKDLEPMDESITATSSRSNFQSEASTSTQSSQSILPIGTAAESPSTENEFQSPARVSSKP